MFYKKLTCAWTAMLGSLQTSSFGAVADAVQGGRGNVRLCFQARSSSQQLKRRRNTLVASSAPVLEAPSASREQGPKLSEDLRRDTAILQVRPA